MDKDKFVYVTLYARIYAKIAITINTALTIVAFALLFTRDVVVYTSSFSKGFQQEFLSNNGLTDKVDLRAVQGFFVEGNPAHDAILKEPSHLNIEYGTTWFSWCWNEPVLAGELPSILRSLEFHSVSQLLLRFTFLVSLSLRPIVCYARSIGVITQLSTTHHPGACSEIAPRTARPPLLLFSFLLYSSPVLQFLSTLAGSFVLTWQQDLDFHGLMWAPYYAFAQCYLLHLLVYSAIELLEPRKLIVGRVITRALLTVGFCATIKPIMDSQMAFLHRKTCNVNVPTLVAICEYFCALIITIFSLLEWTDVWNLHITVVENPEELTTVKRKLGVRFEEEREEERVAKRMFIGTY